MQIGNKLSILSFLKISLMDMCLYYSQRVCELNGFRKQKVAVFFLLPEQYFLHQTEAKLFPHPNNNVPNLINSSEAQYYLMA